ncbi:lysozyme inhibitor LprI family protein [Pantoea ananatis]
MKISFLGCATFIMFGFSSAVYAFDDCAKKTSDADVFSCAENNRAHAEDDLNQAYGATKKRIEHVFQSEPQAKKNYQNLFIQSQRHWLAYRDEQCQLYAHPADKGSNAHTVFNNECVARLDELRTKELSEMPYD